MKTVTELITFINAGHKVRYLPFWGHTPKSSKQVCKSCLSQWYDLSFICDGIQYKTAEHYMMAHKAMLFRDYAAYEKILQSPYPKAAKSIGREIKNFSESVWLKHRFDIVVAGNKAKFSHYSPLREFLLNTGTRILVEASPVDTIWGIGLDASHVHVENPEKWLGLNLLGFALMQVRDELKNNY